MGVAVAVPSYGPPGSIPSYNPHMTARQSQRIRRAVRYGVMMSCALSCCVRLAAHPGTALVADPRGAVYFAYWGGTWKLTADHAERVSGNDLHFMAIDVPGRFAGAALPHTVAVRANSSAPVLFAFPEFPAVFHTDGALYLAPWSVGRIRLDRVTPDGRTARLVDAAIDPSIARPAGRHEGGVLAVASGARGLYVTDGASIWTVDSRGLITPLVKTLVVPNCASDLPAELPRPHIRSLAVAQNGDVYAAATGCRTMIRLSPAGQILATWRAERPWSPCAVTISGQDVYVMEYDNTLAERPADGRPRIRKIDQTGRAITMFVAERQAAGSRQP